MLKKWLAVMAVFSSLFALSGCGYNTMQSQDEAANAAGRKCSTNISAVPI